MRFIQVAKFSALVVILFAISLRPGATHAETLPLQGSARYSLPSVGEQPSKQSSLPAADVVVELREVTPPSAKGETTNTKQIAKTSTDADGMFSLYLEDLNAESTYEVCARSLFGYEGAVSLGYGRTASQWNTNVTITMSPPGVANCKGKVERSSPLFLFNRNWPTKSVFFATDREISIEANQTNVTNEHSIDGKLSFGRCDALIDLEPDGSGSHSFTTRLFKSRDTPATARVKVFASDEAWKIFAQDARARSDKDALLFIHGYKTSFNEACRRAAQIAYELKFEGPLFMYSWPSHDSYLAYAADEEMAEWASPHFQSFFKALLDLQGIRRVHVIAHSMGNRLLYGALTSQHLTLNERRHLGELVFAAPDINRLIFDQTTDFSNLDALRVTLYASAKDQALMASKIFHGYARVGDSKPEIEIKLGMDSIDATSVDTSLLGHSYFGDSRSVLADLTVLIGDNKDPEKRFGLRKEGTASRQWWVMTR